MEFPDLGQQCSISTCKQLDFLPLRCDSCSGVYCLQHYRYDTHNCSNAHMKDNQVPICPLCNKPVATKRGEAPDIGVSEHIDRDCESDRALKKRNAIYKNKCSAKGCKQKEVISLICNDCGLNYCLRHRHTADHNCIPMDKKSSVRTKSGLAALQRFNQNINSTNHQPIKTNRNHTQENQTRNIQSIQGNFSEDEALARALQQSMIDTQRVSSNETKPNVEQREDASLAEAIAASRREMNRNKDKCLIS